MEENKKMVSDEQFEIEHNARVDEVIEKLENLIEDLKREFKIESDDNKKSKSLSVESELNKKSRSINTNVNKKHEKRNNRETR